MQGAEQCDDGNIVGGDGCSTICTIEIADFPPVANAGADQAVNEEQSVTLDGTGSSDPDLDILTYAWTQNGGTTVSLSDATASQPTFEAPTVAIGGGTLGFTLTATANGISATDAVSITVVNINHTPVADAGADQSIAEGAPVALDGSDSFDMDSDSISYSWVQTGGLAVDLSDPNTATPSFTAPAVSTSGAPGIVATLVFTLTVNDGFTADVPADGYTFANVADTETIEITNVNNDPIADANSDQTVNEGSATALNGINSSDPDSDSLTYAWVQLSGPTAAISGENTATPSLTVPFADAGGVDLTFELTVDDGYEGSSVDTMIMHVQNINDPLLVSAAQPTLECIWPPNHKLIAIGINGVSDPNDNATIVIDSVTQDEMTNGAGDGDTPVDAIINDDGTVKLRAERSGKEDGRVYHIRFTASDFEGSASGMVDVCVPHNKKSSAVDGGELYDSTY